MKITKVLLVFGFLFMVGITRIEASAALTATSEVKLIETEATETSKISEILPTETQISPTLVPTEKVSKDMSPWFMGITIAALAVIVVVQAWPKKEDK